jgi:hypothetical protein
MLCRIRSLAPRERLHIHDAVAASSVTIGLARRVLAAETNVAAAVHDGIADKSATNLRLTAIEESHRVPVYAPVIDLSQTLQRIRDKGLGTRSMDTHP